MSLVIKLYVDVTKLIWLFHQRPDGFFVMILCVWFRFDLSVVFVPSSFLFALRLKHSPLLLPKKQTETPSAVVKHQSAANGAADDVGLSPLSKRQRSSQDIFNQTDDSASRNYQSQPMPQLQSDGGTDDEVDGRPRGRFGALRGSAAGAGAGGHAEARNGFCFSQPAMLDDLILCTQLNSTQSASQNLFQKLVRRMTRFFVSTGFEESVRRVQQACVGKLSCQCRVSDEGVVSCRDDNITISLGCNRFCAYTTVLACDCRSPYRRSIAGNCSWSSRRMSSRWTARFCSTSGCRRAAAWSSSGAS